MHAGMHACMHTSMHFLVKPDALMRYTLCLMPMHFVSHLGRRKVACMRLLWACIQALRGCLCTRLHAGMHADALACTVSCTLCPVHHNFVEFWIVSSRFRQRARHMHAGVHACTPKLAYTLACILYLADLHGRIDSACMHEA